MIYFNFSITMPFKKPDFQKLFEYQKLVTSHKMFNLGLYKYNSNLVEVNMDLNWAGKNHAGPYLYLGLMGYQVGVAFYDTRHWDEINDRWEEHEPDCQTHS